MSQQLREAWMGWLGRVPWQVFGTLEYARGRQSVEAGERHVHAYLDLLEREHRCRITAAGCVESHPAAPYRAASGVHHHLVMAAPRPLHEEVMVDLWTRFFGGRGRNVVRIGPYELAMGGLAYIQKRLGPQDVVWFHRLEEQPAMRTDR